MNRTDYDCLVQNTLLKDISNVKAPKKKKEKWIDTQYPLLWFMVVAWGVIVTLAKNLEALI